MFKKNKAIELDKYSCAQHLQYLAFDGTYICESVSAKMDKRLIDLFYAFDILLHGTCKWTNVYKS